MTPHMLLREDLVERIRRDVRPDEGQVPTWAHADPDVHQLELRRLFGRTWLFVAHESELAGPNGYVVREMGEQSVIVARGEDGSINVLLNVCRHRGMRVVNDEGGCAGRFRCPFHGFTYANDGRLVAVPFQRDAYDEGLDRTGLGLLAARVAVYRGLVFATWAADAEPLDEHLGDLRWYLDIVAGRAEMEVLGPPQRWIVRSAWKLPAENFASDAYHTATTHAFLGKLALSEGTDFGRVGYHVDAGRGHGLGIGVQDDGPWYPPELRSEYEEQLSPEQLALLDRVKNFHGNVFPNLSFLIPNVIEIEGRRVTGTTLRQWQPLGPDRMRVYSWYLVERAAPEWWKELGRRTYLLTFGASGMLEQDDTVIWEAQTASDRSLLVREEAVALDYTMGLGRKPLDTFPGPGDVYDGKFNEAAARNFWRRWRDELVGQTS